MKTEIKRRVGIGGQMELDELQYFYVLGEMTNFNPKLGVKAKWKLHTHTHTQTYLHTCIYSLEQSPKNRE